MNPVHYHSGAFQPYSLNYEKILPYASQAQRALGRYNGVLEGVINPDILISPMINREAERSSRIKGTQATLREVLEYEAENSTISRHKENDIREIVNYRIALKESIDRLDDLPLSQRLIREAHKTLMQGVRGESSNPGNYRDTQNWIGPIGWTEETATFLPCAVNELQERLAIWENYIHGNQLDALIQMAIVHAEFEAIHPFADGNGRIGRLIVPLFLYEKKLIKRPSFYISEELERQREAYYNALKKISEHKSWEDWCCFFLNAVTEQANNNFHKAKAILELHETSRSKVADITGSPNASRALDYIFTRPLFNTTQFRRENPEIEP